MCTQHCFFNFRPNFRSEPLPDFDKLQCQTEDSEDTPQEMTLIGYTYIVSENLEYEPNINVVLVEYIIVK